MSHQRSATRGRPMDLNVSELLPAAETKMNPHTDAAASVAITPNAVRPTGRAAASSSAVRASPVRRLERLMTATARATTAKPTHHARPFARRRAGRA